MKLDVIETFTFEDQDFKSTVAKLKGNTYDAIGVYRISMREPVIWLHAVSASVPISNPWITPIPQPT